MMVWFKLDRIPSRKSYRRGSTWFCSRDSRPISKRAGHLVRTEAVSEQIVRTCALSKDTSVARSKSARIAAEEACLWSRFLKKVSMVTGWLLPIS